jgi:glycosyltransferase involved in cell wall biosynthesis
MKIFYMSCHSVHEYDEVRMFNKLGHQVFSPSAYMNPQNEDHLRPGIEGLVYDPIDVEKFHKLALPGTDNKDNLTTDFLKPFDVIFVMSLADRWIVKQWDIIKDKIVIWRTNGQSNSVQELKMKSLKEKYPNLKIARYSPTERTMTNYAGEDCMIRFGKRPDEYCDWNGKNKRVMSLCQNMIGRSRDCSWGVFEQIAKTFPTTLYGMSNEDNEFWIGRKLLTSELIQAMQDNLVYFYTGTKPANYTLNFIEAWMTGIPVVAVGPKIGNAIGYNTYEIQNLIKNGINGFVSDNIEELKSCVSLLLNNYDLCKQIGKNGRISAIKHFNEYDKEIEWKKFFDEL